MVAAAAVAIEPMASDHRRRAFEKIGLAIEESRWRSL